jgi:hypothetical protein
VTPRHAAVVDRRGAGRALGWNFGRRALGRNPRYDDRGRLGLVVAAGVVLVAASLRLWRIRQSYELFIDEITYTEIARSVALGQGVVLYGEPFFLHPPAMFGSLALAMTVIGPGEDISALALALRPLPAVLGALTPGLVALMLHRTTGSPIVAATGGLLLAIEPFLIRFDSRVLLEAQAMATSAAGFLVLLVVAGRERDGRPVHAFAVAAGLLLLASLLTKETYAFVGILPVCGLLLTGLGMHRRTSATVVVTVAAGYAAYVLALVLAGQGNEWFAQKTRGIRRLLGLTQITGFNEEGSVGFVDRIVANLGYYAATYSVIGAGFLALGWLLLQLRRGAVPEASRPQVMLLVAWALGATAHVAYAVTLGTLEEQMFYLLVAVTVPVTFVSAHLVLGPRPEGPPSRPLHSRRTSPGARQPALVIALVAALATNSAVWVYVHTVPDTAYVRFLDWARAELPPDSVVAVTDETTQFVLQRVRVGRWETGAELREHHADFVVIVGELVRQGYSDVDEDFLRLARQAPVVFEAQGRTTGAVTVHDVRQIINH